MSLHLGVPKNRGYPKMDGLYCNGKPYENGMIWGVPFLENIHL